MLRATTVRHCCQLLIRCADLFLVYLNSRPRVRQEAVYLGTTAVVLFLAIALIPNKWRGLSLPKMVRWRPSAMTHLQPKRASGCMRGAPRQARTRIARSSTGYGTNSGARQLSRHCADWHCTFCSLCRPAQASSHLDRAFASGSAGTWNASPGPHAALSLDGSTSGNSVRSHCYLNFHG